MLIKDALERLRKLAPSIPNRDSDNPSELAEIENIGKNTRKWLSGGNSNVCHTVYGILSDEKLHKAVIETALGSYRLVVAKDGIVDQRLHMLHDSLMCLFNAVGCKKKGKAKRGSLVAKPWRLSPQVKLLEAMSNAHRLLEALKIRSVCVKDAAIVKDLAHAILAESLCDISDMFGLQNLKEKCLQAHNIVPPEKIVQDFFKPPWCGNLLVPRVLHVFQVLTILTVKLWSAFRPLNSGKVQCCDPQSLFSADSATQAQLRGDIRMQECHYAMLVIQMCLSVSRKFYQWHLWPFQLTDKIKEAITYKYQDMSDFAKGNSFDCKVVIDDTKNALEWLGKLAESMNITDPKPPSRGRGRPGEAEKSERIRALWVENESPDMILEKIEKEFPKKKLIKKSTVCRICSGLPGGGKN